MSHYQIKSKINDLQIDDLVCNALEGGINYWCTKVTVKDNDYKGGEWASDVISRGGVLILHDAGESNDQELTLKKLLAGISKYKSHDFDNMDAYDADCIVQLAIFGKVIYG